MSSRRAPLSSNPNAANSPLRGAAALAANVSKSRRSHASAQREDAYGQPPPAKRQMLDIGARGTLRSPVKQKAGSQRGASRAPAGSRTTQAAPHKLTGEEVEEIRKWQQNQRSRFPKFVFYFESVPDDHRARLARQAGQLGAREEKFFSIDITHVVTTRPIPPEKPAGHNKGENTEAAQEEHEQPQTINPSLLNRYASAGASSISTKRKLFENTAGRRLPMPAQDDAIRRPKPVTRNADVLHRARDMGKKIWSLEKVQKVLQMLLEPDPYRAAAMGYGLGNGSAGNSTSTSRAAEESTLLQLLHKERVTGPSDRDRTVASRELIYFKGPYIYVYDIEEKQKPILVREYAKVADKENGDWPQFRASASGRCPFVEDVDFAEKKASKRREKESAAKAAVEAVPKLQPPEVPPPKPVTGKRTLTEMEDGHNRRMGTTSLRPTEIFDTAKAAAAAPVFDFQPQNAFTSRAKAGRFLAGEPVASGVQPSGITSAIRSQMISSATGTMGAKAGTSKEIHDLQRRVLQKSGPTSQDLSSRRMAEMSMDHPNFTRSASLGRTSHRKLDMIDESGREEKHKRTLSVPVQTKPKKRDPKPGYCENCQDKFDDFDEHIASRKHRKFADNTDNWADLDGLLCQLTRTAKYTAGDDDSHGEW